MRLLRAYLAACVLVFGAFAIVVALDVLAWGLR